MSKTISILVAMPLLIVGLILAGCSSGGDRGPSDDSPMPALGRAVSANSKKDVDKVIYSHLSSGNLSLDVIRPKEENSLHRAVLLIHGGGWVSGSRADMDEIGRYLVAKGFLCASVEYRLAPRALWPAQLDDVRTAVRYLRAHAKELGISAEKIGAAGISAGGHLSLFLGTTDAEKVKEYSGFSSRVQAVGSISGIHDLNEPLTRRGEMYGIIQRLLGEHGTVDKPARSAASPSTFYSAQTAPTMFIQGKEDLLVPPEQSTQAEAKLKALGVPTEVVMVEGMGHGLSPGPQPEAEALDRLAGWLKKYLL